MYGRSFDRKKRKTPRNTQTPHKLKRDPGVERGEIPSRFFHFTIRHPSVTTHRRSQRQRALRSRRAGAAPTRLTPARTLARAAKAFGPENTPAVRLPGPSHYASMGQGITSFAFHALDPMRKRSGRPGRQNIGRKEVKTVFDPDQGKSFLEWVLILLRLFREIRELGPKKEKTTLPPKSSHRKKR